MSRAIRGPVGAAWPGRHDLGQKTDYSGRALIMTIYVAIDGDSIGDKFIHLHIKFNSIDFIFYLYDFIDNSIL